jgi:hypothetical protein
MKHLLLSALLILSLTACVPASPRVHVDNGYMNVRNMGDSYVHYEIMDGDNMITCREHMTRSELACWPTIETYPDEGF